MDPYEVIQWAAVCNVLLIMFVLYFSARLRSEKRFKEGYRDEAYETQDNLFKVQRELGDYKKEYGKRQEEIEALNASNERLSEQWSVTAKERRLLDLRLRVVKFALECEDDKHLEHILIHMPNVITFEACDYDENVRAIITDGCYTTDTLESRPRG